MNIPLYRISLGEHWKGRREGKTEMAMLIYISYNALVNNKIYYTCIHHSALLLFKIREYIHSIAFSIARCTVYVYQFSLKGFINVKKINVKKALKG